MRSAPEEDVDAIFAELGIKANVCFSATCKTSTRLLGRTCQFCKQAPRSPPARPPARPAWLCPTWPFLSRFQIPTGVHNCSGTAWSTQCLKFMAVPTMPRRMRATRGCLTARKSSRPSRHAGLPAALAGPALLAQSSHSSRECYCRSPITAEHDPSLWTVRPPPDAISANALLRTPPRTACSGI